MAVIFAGNYLPSITWACENILCKSCVRHICVPGSWLLTSSFFKVIVCTCTWSLRLVCGVVFQSAEHNTTAQCCISHHYLHPASRTTLYPACCAREPCSLQGEQVCVVFCLRQTIVAYSRQQNILVGGTVAMLLQADAINIGVLQWI